MPWRRKGATCYLPRAQRPHSHPASDTSTSFSGLQHRSEAQTPRSSLPAPQERFRIAHHRCRRRRSDAGGCTIPHPKPSTRAHGNLHHLHAPPTRTSKTRLSFTLGCPLTLTSTSSRARCSDCHCARCTDVVGSGLGEGRPRNPDPDGGTGDGDRDDDRRNDEEEPAAPALAAAAAAAPEPIALAPKAAPALSAALEPPVSRVQTNVTCGEVSFGAVGSANENELGCRRRRPERLRAPSRQFARRTGGPDRPRRPRLTKRRLKKKRSLPAWRTQM